MITLSYNVIGVYIIADMIKLFYYIIFFDKLLYYIFGIHLIGFFFEATKEPVIINHFSSWREMCSN
jgi:hypothetical protein